MAAEVALGSSEEAKQDIVDPNGNVNDKDDEKADEDMPSKIIDQLYLGTVHHAWNKDIIEKLHITHIVCCIGGAVNKDQKRLMVPMDDRGHSKLSHITERAFPWMEQAMKEDEKNNILVHCKSAVNRSPTVTVAFLMYYKKQTLKEAHQIVYAQHDRICCHDSYMAQLREYDKELHGQYSTKPDELETTSSMMAKLRQQFMTNNNK